MKKERKGFGRIISPSWDWVPKLTIFSGDGFPFTHYKRFCSRPNLLDDVGIWSWANTNGGGGEIRGVGKNVRETRHKQRNKVEKKDSQILIMQTRIVTV